MIEKIFEMLGVIPHERFNIDDPNNNLIYFFDGHLDLYYDSLSKPGEVTKSASLDIKDFLNGNVHIIPISKKDITENDKIAIAYARACGHKYIVQIEDGTFIATKQKPFKRFFFDNSDSLIPCFNWKLPSYKHDDILILEMPISCVHSNDEEPFYIGD